MGYDDFMVRMSKGMTNQEVAELLKLMGAAHEAKKENFFVVRAYQNAAASIEHATSDIRDLWQEGKLKELAGIGGNIAGYLDELFRTGKVKHFEEEMRGLPEGMFEILTVSGIGPKSAIRLAREFKLVKGSLALKKLQEVAKKGLIAKLEGFGEEKQKKILEAIEEKIKRKGSRERLLLPEAELLAEEIKNYLKGSELVEEVEALGSLRRKTATVGDVDLAVKTEKPDRVMVYLAKFPGIKKIISTGEKTTMFIHKSGRQVDVKTQSGDKWGSILQHYTGSKLHNIHLRQVALEKKMSLSEHGIKKNGKLFEYETEEDFYKALGMDYIPPELREDVGEIELAMKHRLPSLVELTDIRGDFHLHTNLPIETSHDMGANSVRELVAKAGGLGYEYVGLSDHNPKLLGLSENKRIEVIKRRNEAIDKQIRSSENGVKVFKGLEVDIRPDGELAISDESLELLDYAVVSVHSSLDQNKIEATKRILAGLAHPNVRIWGHPTGRILNQRDGLDYDWEKVLEFCRDNNIWVEINASPMRLDLPDVLVREAVKMGVKIVIDTDSHAVEQMDSMKYGVAVARRGWAEKRDVINTLPLSDMMKMV